MNNQLIIVISYLAQVPLLVRPLLISPFSTYYPLQRFFSRMVNTKQQHADPVPGVDWRSFGFGWNGVETEFMWLDTVAVASIGKNDDQVTYSTDATKQIGAAAEKSTTSRRHHFELWTRFVWRSQKAFRRANGTIVLFWPESDAERMWVGAQRFLLPAVPIPVFIEVASAVVRANVRWAPPLHQGALYLRPLLFRSGLSGRVLFGNVYRWILPWSTLICHRCPTWHWHFCVGSSAE